MIPFSIFLSSHPFHLISFSIYILSSHSPICHFISFPLLPSRHILSPPTSSHSSYLSPRLVPLLPSLLIPHLSTSTQFQFFHFLLYPFIPPRLVKYSNIKDCRTNKNNNNTNVVKQRKNKTVDLCWQ